MCVSASLPQQDDFTRNGGIRLGNEQVVPRTQCTRRQCKSSSIAHTKSNVCIMCRSSSCLFWFCLVFVCSFALVDRLQTRKHSWKYPCHEREIITFVTFRKSHNVQHGLYPTVKSYHMAAMGMPWNLFQQQSAGLGARGRPDEQSSLNQNVTNVII